MLAWLVPHETAAVLVQILYTPYNHAPCHFTQSHIGKVYACLAVTCQLHFWQNDWDLLHATEVTWGWNGYRNKSQHRKSTLEKKILPPLLQGFEPTNHESGALTTKLTPHHPPTPHDGQLHAVFRGFISTECYQYTTSVDINNTCYQRDSHSFGIICQCAQ